MKIFFALGNEKTRSWRKLICDFLLSRKIAFQTVPRCWRRRQEKGEKKTKKIRKREKERKREKKAERGRKALQTFCDSRRRKKEEREREREGEREGAGK